MILVCRVLLRLLSFQSGFCRPVRKSGPYCSLSRSHAALSVWLAVASIESMLWHATRFVMDGPG